MMTARLGEPFVKIYYNGLDQSRGATSWHEADVTIEGLCRRAESNSQCLVA